MSETDEVPAYRPPAGVHGPTLGRDLPDGCERLIAGLAPATAPADFWLTGDSPNAEALYWWRWPALKVGDRVQLTGTVTQAHAEGCFVKVDNDDIATWFPPAALTRVVDQ